MALLDSTPPSPQVAEASSPASFGALAPENPMGPLPDMGGIMDLGRTVDESLLLLAQAIPAGAQEISQARDLVKNAIAQALVTSGAPGPPAEPGNQFPGAPIGSGQP